MEYALPLSMVACLLLGIFSGYPVAFVLGGIGVLFAFIGELPFAFLKIGVSRIYAGVIENWLLLAVPLFVFMGSMLDKSGLAQNLLYSLERALGHFERVGRIAEQQKNCEQCGPRPTDGCRGIPERGVRMLAICIRCTEQDQGQQRDNDKQGLVRLI